MAVPVWSVGQVLTADDVNSWLVQSSAIKPSDTSRTGTTQTADPDLVLALAANANYYITGYFTVGGAAVTTGDIKFSFTGPGGGTVATWTALRVDTSGNTTLANPNSPGTGNTVIGGTSNSTDRAITVWASVDTSSTAGSWTLFWSQNTNNTGTPTVLRANSVLVAQRTG